jgi:hypothetical protein
MILLELAFVVSVLVWGVYAMFRAPIETVFIVTLLAAGIIFLLIVGQESYGGWLIGLDAFACSDQAEILMEAAPGPGAGVGSTRGWDFFNCTIYWRDRPGRWG